MIVVCDVETNDLWKPTNIWCVVAKDVETGEVYEFRGEDEVRRRFPQFSTRVSGYIGHNFLEFDLPVLNNLLGLSIPAESVSDTLILSRLLNFNIDGGHSLEAWGERLGIPKVGLEVSFSEYSDELFKRCVSDVEINFKLYHFLKGKMLDRPDFSEAIKVEHEIARICLQMTKDGFYFDVPSGIKLRDRLSKRIDELDKVILDSFPPRSVPQNKTYTPRETKHGTISRTSVPRSWGPNLTDVALDCPFQLLVWEQFNPQSTTQVVQRLHNFWSPVDKTKGYLEAEKSKDKEKLKRYEVLGWKLNEKNFATLKPNAPKGAQHLVERLFLASRWRTVNDWLSRVDPRDHSVHAKFNGIGTWTHRMSHKEPNLGNVAAPKSIKYKSEYLAGQAIELGAEMRSLWRSSSPEESGPETWLVGTDAVGIQLRIFAHYIDDKDFTKALLEGKSSDGSDAHSRNASILGCERDTAKTFIYAFLLGAGDSKIAEILGVSRRAGTEAKSRFIEAYPGLARLRRDIIPRDARRGFFVGFDGRLVVCDSEHLMLAGYLQNGEACVMKHACVDWRKRCDTQGLRYSQVNFVHDEWQTKVLECYEKAELVASIQREAIERTGQAFALRCPMSGESKIGKTWHDTH